MIKRFILSLLGFYYFFFSNAQTTITLQPDATEGKDAVIFYVTSQSTSKGSTNTTNYGNDSDLPAMEWTFDGSPGRKQGLIEFDLSSIPAGATITSADLSLYHSANSQDIGHSTLSGSNETLIQRITSDWQESTVTWNTKPSVTTQNQVILSSSTSDTEDYENIDVLALIQDMIDDPANSHGLMISMQTQDYYRKMVFASSDHANSSLHPKLVITYNSTSSCLTLQPDATEGKDAVIFYVTSQSTSKGSTNTTNYGNDPDLPAMEWTFDGSPGRKQGLIEFDLSSIPAQATITSANLSLYHSANSQDIGHSTLSGSNETLIQRITSDWQESTVTWNTKPSVTTQNQVILSSSTSDTEDYENIDVLALIQDMIDDPANSHGLMISMQTQNYYRKMIFASSDHANSSLHPKLEICYSIVSSIDKPITSKSLQTNIQPNPFSDHTQLTIETNNSTFSNFDIKVFDITGAEVISMNNVSDKLITINRDNLKQGIYFYQVLSHGEVVARGKMVIKD